MNMKMYKDFDEFSLTPLTLTNIDLMINHLTNIHSTCKYRFKGGIVHSVSFSTNSQNLKHFVSFMSHRIPIGF